MSDSLLVPSNWSQVSSRYQAQMGGSTDRANARMLEYVFARKPLTAESYCLDVGTGGGSIPVRLQEWQKGTKTLATDLSPGMVQQIENLKLENVRAQVEDAVTLAGLKDATFSHVFTAFAIQYTSNPAATVEQLYRVLQPGGIAGIAICGDFVSVVEVHNRACLALMPEYKIVRHFVDSAWSDVVEHRRVLEAIGLRNVQVDICLVPWQLNSTDEFCDFWFGDNPVPRRMIQAAESQGIDRVELRQKIVELLESDYDSGRQLYLTAVLGIGQK